MAGDPFDKDPETTSLSDEEWLDRRASELHSRSGSDSGSGDSSYDSDSGSEHSTRRTVVGGSPRAEGVVVEERGITGRTGSSDDEVVVIEEDSPPRRRLPRRR
jgi:hypothetical protein